MNIIVTGASKGIGYELCKKFSEINEVEKIIAIARDEEKLESLQLLSDKIKILPYDITNLIKVGFNTFLLKLELDKVDILINNAGTLINKDFCNTSDKEIAKIFDTNYFAPAKLTNVLLPLMRRSENAHIVNISSMGGFQGSKKFQGLSHYSASKAAIATLTECLAEELKDSTVKINCLALGAVQTEMLSSAFPCYEAPVNAAQMAEFIVDFAINGSRFFNGKIIPVSLSSP